MEGKTKYFFSFEDLYFHTISIIPRLARSIGLYHSLSRQHKRIALSSKSKVLSFKFQVLSIKKSKPQSHITIEIEGI
jgi:hypothetical protein